MELALPYLSKAFIDTMAADALVVTGQGLGAQDACARHDAPAPGAAAPAHQAQSDLIGQQFIIGQPLERQCAGGGVWRLAGADGGGEVRPALPPQQGGIMPFRQMR